MKILHYIADRSTGIFMYRCYFPSTAIQNHTKNIINFSNNCNDKNIHDLAEMNWADIIIFHRQHLQETIEIAKKLKKIGKKIVYEIDDDWFNLNPDNPFKEKLDKKPEIMEGLIEFLKISDAVTTTTETLAKKLRVYNPNVYVIPNYVSSYYFDYRSIPQEKNEQYINLLWSGAANHEEDLKILIEPLKEIFKKHTNVNFINIGTNYTDHFYFIPKENLYYVCWTDIEQYCNNYKFGDIALAPMADNKFNASKSNIRILEAGYFDLPVIASDIYSYGESIKQNVNGIKCKSKEDWINALSLLIENEQERKKMATENKKYADSMTIEQNYGKYLKAYKDILNV